MSKKFGKFLLFSALAGAAAYGAYQYLQNKEKTVSPAEEEDTDDDFDDFSEDLDDEPAPEKERSYVSLNLDKAAAIATESFHKAKDVISGSVQQVRDTVKSVTESQMAHETNFTDLTALQKEAAASNEEPVQEEAFFDDEAETKTNPEAEMEATASTGDEAETEPKTPSSSGKVEEFYNDDTP